MHELHINVVSVCVFRDELGVMHMDFIYLCVCVFHDELGLCIWISYTYSYMNFIRTSYSTYYRQKGRGGGYITRTSLEVSRNDTALKLLKNSTQAVEVCDEVNREVLFA